MREKQSERLEQSMCDGRLARERQRNHRATEETRRSARAHRLEHVLRHTHERLSVELEAGATHMTKFGVSSANRHKRNTEFAVIAVFKPEETGLLNEEHIVAYGIYYSSKEGTLTEADLAIITWVARQSFSIYNWCSHS